MKMWHGGAPGRRVHDELLPPSSTAFSPTNAELTGKPQRGKRRSYKPTMVYATTDRQFAEVWALLYTQDPNRPGDGLVYEVELESPGVDSDFSRVGTCFEAPKGVVKAAGVPVSSPNSVLNEVLEQYRRHGVSVNAERAAEARLRAKHSKAKAARKVKNKNRRRR